MSRPAPRYRVELRPAAGGGDAGADGDGGGAAVVVGWAASVEAALRLMDWAGWPAAPGRLAVVDQADGRTVAERPPAPAAARPRRP